MLKLPLLLKLQGVEPGFEAKVYAGGCQILLLICMRVGLELSYTFPMCILVCLHLVSFWLQGTKERWCFVTNA